MSICLPTSDSAVLRFALVAFVLGSPAPLWPEDPSPARVVADLVTEPRNSGSAPYVIADAGDEILVAADDGIHGYEPWLLDRSGGARLLADICPGRCPSMDPERFADFVPAGRPFSDLMSGALTDNGLAFFFAIDGQSNIDLLWGTAPALWVTDFTPEGTRLAYRDSLYDFAELTAFGDRIVFRGNGPEDGGYEPWVSDGTPAGTREISDVDPSGSSYPISFHQIGDRVLFSAHTEDFGREWWRWDGTNPPELVADTCPGPCDGFLPAESAGVFEVLTEDRLFFVAPPVPQSGNRTVWTTDGTAGGTFRLFDSIRYQNARLLSDGESVFFTAEDGSFWQTDGTAEGTSEFQGLPPNAGTPNSVVSFGSTSGTSFVVATSTELILFENGGPPETVATGSSLFDLRELDDHLVFRDGEALHSIRKSDFGVQQLVGFEFSEPDYRFRIHQFGDEIFFRGTDAAGDELWASNGTPGGTRRLADIRAPRTDSNPRDLVQIGDHVVFLADTGSEQPWPGTSLEIWSSNGAGAERLKVGGSPQLLEPVGDLVFFQVFQEGLGYEPWVSDGTPEGTRSLGDLQPGPRTSVAREPVWWNGKIYFFADQDLGSGDSGQKLWVSDGTAQGTRVVIDVQPDFTNDCSLLNCFSPEDDFLPRELTLSGDRLVFVAGNPRENDLHLWVSDGSQQNSGAVFAGGDGPLEIFEPSKLIATSDRFYFLGQGPDLDYGLWSTSRDLATPPVLLHPHRVFGALPVPGLDHWFSFLSYFQAVESDGTTGGTREIDLPYGSNFPRIAVDDRVFFVSADLRNSERLGGELWIADGTPTGTRLVADLRPGSQTSGPNDFATDGEYLYFTADDGETGHEIWRTDGDSVERLTDLAPGPATAAPSDLTLVGSQLYFSADSEFGRELWAMPKSGQAGCTRDATHHCLADGRFRVSTRWRVPATGEQGQGHVVDAEGAGTDDTGYFYFFGGDNVEFAVKVLDGRPLNNHRWVFTGALTDVEVWLDVFDTSTGLEKTWHRPPGDLCGFADVEAFPEVPNAPPSTAEIRQLRSASEASASPKEHGVCESNANTLCLHDRFEVRVRWHQNDKLFQARAVPFTDETGQFWFFGPENVEVILKILDARTLNDHWWIFHGVLTDLPLEIEVTDTINGQTWFQSTAGGDLCGGADTSAFPG